jgi:hypothetical protein
MVSRPGSLEDSSLLSTDTSEEEVIPDEIPEELPQVLPEDIP